ncbi:hypothetical protein [Ensifer sesbaniae]|uniref:hypothetical protein n=1 Tax=Ensifer sesbaniae TaxID=1214071 RepID=UPI001AEE2BC3|nr:hypothetical protein [Ensifer sesbaniae]
MNLNLPVASTALNLRPSARHLVLPAAQRAQIIESTAGNLAKALFQTGMTGINSIGGGNANGIKAAITLASANLSLDDRIALINSLNVYAENHAKDVGNAVERARITTALVLAAGPIAEVSPAVAACMANLVCRNEAAIAVGEMMAGDALGGGTLAVGGGVAAMTSDWTLGASMHRTGKNLNSQAILFGMVSARLPNPVKNRGFQRWEV